MATSDYESGKVRLKLILQKEILPGIVYIAGPLPTHFAEFLHDHVKLIRPIKDQYLEESGAFEDGKLFYLYKGIAHSYHYTSFNDKLNISRIWVKGDVIFDLNSFQNERDRDDDIRMLEDGELLYIRYSALCLLLELFPKMVVILLWIQIEREVHYREYQDLLKLSVDERVAAFLDEHPGIMARINNDYIALYLNMARGTLSIAYNLYKKGKENNSDL